MAFSEIPLGKETVYVSQYDAGLLFPIARSENRAELNLQGWPWFGEDIWTAYEVSWLNPKGRPVVAIAEFFIPASSDNIIESKSFKLYLNSFNQTRFENQQAVLECITQDISAALQAPAKVVFHPVDEFPVAEKIIGQCIDEEDIDVNIYHPDASLLQFEDGVVEECLFSHLLKSNCPVTSQPDWATVSIEYLGRKLNRGALLRYVLSFREHNDFHEHCVERMFTDLMATGHIQALTVSARYTRRGGLDINPTRSTNASFSRLGRTARQ